MIDPTTADGRFLLLLALERMRQDGWDKGDMVVCYDTPMFVLHHGLCGAFTRGGVCRPVVMSADPPYSASERRAIFEFLSVLVSDEADVAVVPLLGAVLESPEMPGVGYDAQTRRLH